MANYHQPGMHVGVRKGFTCASPWSKPSYYVRRTDRSLWKPTSRNRACKFRRANSISECQSPKACRQETLHLCALHQQLRPMRMNQLARVQDLCPPQPNDDRVCTQPETTEIFPGGLSRRAAPGNMAYITLPSTTLTLACTSDTHNDDPTARIPDADIFVHAGDMTDDGTFDELKVAFTWIAALPHKLKVIVAGNHDLGLDPTHPAFSPQAHDLFTRDQALRHGIVYLDRECRTVAQCQAADGKLRPFKVYGNPCQPDFLKSNYAFTYLPWPEHKEGAEEAWKGAPNEDEDVSLWICHSPPKGILDAVPVDGLTGCELMRRKLSVNKPKLCVFGHYHSSYGRIRCAWDLDPNGAIGEGSGPDDAIVEVHIVEDSEKTEFLNAAWMTMQKKTVERRNKPWLVRLQI